MLNHIELMGRVSSDVKIVETQSSGVLAQFSVAVPRDWKNNQTGHVDADFFRCVAFNKTAGFISEYFTKGKEILLTGRLQSRTYTDKDGVKRTLIEILVGKVYFCGGRTEKTDDEGYDNYGENNVVEKRQFSGYDTEDIDDDDVPF